MMMMLEIIVLQADKDKIVAHHNKLRAKIANGEEKRGLSGPQPSAANMRMLTWNDDLALVAQRFAIYKSCIIVYRIFKMLKRYHNECKNLIQFKSLDGLINAQDDPMMSIEEQTNINLWDKIMPGEVRQQIHKSLKS